MAAAAGTAIAPWPDRPSRAAPQIDGGGLVGYGKHFFNNPSGQVWNQFRFSFNSNPWGRLSQGAHTINTGVYVLGGQCTFDSNSGGTAIGFEVPS